MRNLLLTMLALSFSMSVFSEKISYELVVDVKSKRMGQYVVRYLIAIDSMCMGNIQSLTSGDGNNWSIYRTKTLCELDGKSTATDFTDATITKVEFNENSIRMVISTTELRPTGEYLRHCTIKVNKGEFSPMRCSKPERAEDFVYD